MHQLRARRPGRALAAALVLAGLLRQPVLGAPSAADQEIAAAERRVEGTAVTPDDYVALATAFMRKSRELGDPGYYARANAAVERALALDPNHYGALRAAPWVLLGLHDFRGALAAAERVRALEPEDWWNYGTLADAYVALGGVGRVRAAEGQLAAAGDLYRRAVARVPAPDLIAALGDVYEAAGDADEAERQYALVEYVGKVAEAVGTTYGRQLALFYADHNRRPEEALRLARLEAAGRGDIYTDDTLAWACYKNGRLAEAARAAHRALRLGTEDAMLHYHAGTIAAALGHERIAARHLRRALGFNPHFDLRQAPRARAALAVLERAAPAARDGAR